MISADLFFILMLLVVLVVLVVLFTICLRYINMYGETLKKLEIYKERLKAAENVRESFFKKAREKEKLEPIVPKYESTLRELSDLRVQYRERMMRDGNKIKELESSVIKKDDRISRLEEDIKVARNCDDEVALFFNNGEITYLKKGKLIKGINSLKIEFKSGQLLNVDEHYEVF